MAYITHRTRDMVDAMAKGAFGESVSELKTTVTNTIVNLYSKMQLSVDEIAEAMGLEAKEVHDVLKKQKLIKK